MFTSLLLLLILGTRLVTSVYKVEFTQIHTTETAGYLNYAQLWFGHSKLLEIWVFRGSTNMTLSYFLYVIQIIVQVSTEFSANINNNNTKKLEEQVKELSLKIQKLEKKMSINKKKSRCCIRKPISILSTANCYLTTSAAHAYAEMMLEY